MKQLPVHHESAQALYDDLLNAQVATVHNPALCAADIIHRVEYIYDIKQQIACELIRMEKKLHSLREAWESDEANNVVRLR